MNTKIARDTMPINKGYLAPIGSAAKLYAPALNSEVLDVLGGVGEHYLPQRITGMGLGAILGRMYSDPENKNVGAVMGGGLGYLGSMGMDEAIRRYRRSILDGAIVRGLNIGSIVHNTPKAALKDVLDTQSLLIGGTYMSEPAGMIVNNYEALHKLKNDAALRKKLLSEFPDVNHKTKQWVDHFIDTSPILDPKPEHVVTSIDTHELLERKHMFYEKPVKPAVNNKPFIGKALDVYGGGADMGHVSMGVLGDEINLAQRALTPKEIDTLRYMREMTGESPFLKALRNVDDLYSSTINNADLSNWTTTAQKALDRGIKGELLPEAEAALLRANLYKRIGGSANSKLRRIENSVVGALSEAISPAISKLELQAKKYLPKLLHL